MTTRTRLGALLAAILVAGLGTCNATNTCCDKLEAATSSGKVFRDTSPEYTTENSDYWSPSCVLTPRCIFTPTSASDVSTAIKILTRNNCQFATRGGGHTLIPGWAGTSSGVLISLSHLNSIQMSDDNASVIIGAGNRWGDVYVETGKHGVSVAGGRVPAVGVSGFLLGGGLSFLMNEVGFAANSVLAYDIVLANGTLATVTRDASPDLFKALKGGSGNFGIVTSFHLKTYQIGDVYSGNLHYSSDSYNDLLPLIESYARNGAESDPKSHLICLFASVPSQSINMASFYGFYSDPVTSPPPSIKPFVDLPTVANTLKVKTMKEAADELNGVVVDGQRSGFGTYSIRADASLFKQLLELWQKSTNGLNSTDGWSSGMVFQPISNGMIRASNERGGNVLGMQPMDDPLIVVNYYYTWSSPADNEKVYAAIKKLTEDSKEIARSHGKLADYLYLNYANPYQEVFESYGQPQVDFLKDVKAKYDPQGVFTKLSPGGFKIPL